MSTDPGAAHGRRDNGLPANDWGALVDLDPRLSEALLRALFDAGVAAYVEPAGGLDPFSRASMLPGRPLDRLWVDPVQADTARAVVAAEVADLTGLLAEDEPGATAYGFVQPVPRSAARRVLAPPALPGPPAGPSSPPEPSAPLSGPPEPAVDDDEAWRRIVEGYGRDGEHPVPPWPVSEDVERPPGRTLFPSRPERSDEPPRRRRRDAEADAEAELPSWVEPEALDDNEHYVPPPPPPVPRIQPRMLAGVAAMLLGLLLLFVPTAVGVFQLAPSGVFLLGLTGLIGGAATVVMQMRDAPPTDSGPDDGAVV